MQTFIESSNLTHSEFYRLNGALSTERLESCLDAIDILQSKVESAGYANDASAGYIGEDFLSKQLKELTQLAKTLRGANRQTLLYIIEDIQEQVLTEVRNGEYGAECLTKITDALPG